MIGVALASLLTAGTSGSPLEDLTSSSPPLPETWTICTERTLLAARPAMMKPWRESSCPVLLLFAGKIAADSTVLRRLYGGLVANLRR